MSSPSDRTRVRQPAAAPAWWKGHGAFLLLLGVAALAYTSFLGRVPLFDWDELNFAEVAREMLVLGDWSRVHINYELFWEKPPLFFWLQAASMKLFGVDAFAARFPNAVLGLLNLLLLYLLGQRLEDRRLGFYWALAWFGSFLPHLYAKSGIIDPLFNLCMLLGLYAVLEASWILEARSRAKPVAVDALPGNHGPHARAVAGHTRSRAKAVASPAAWGAFAAGGIALGLAVLAKGPVGLLLPGLTVLVYLFLRPGQALRSMPRFWLGLALTGAMVAITAGSWFLYDWLRNGSWFTESFLAYQWRLLRTEDAGHGGFPGFHPTALLLGCFPASLLALKTLPWVLGGRIGSGSSSAAMASGSRRSQAWGSAMLVLLLVVLLVFGLVQSKIVHYSSMAYYPLSFLAGFLLWQWENRGLASRTSAVFGKGSGKGFTLAFWGIAGLWCMGLVLAFAASRNSAQVATWIQDSYAAAQWSLVPTLPWWTLIPALVLPLSLWGALAAFRRGFARRGAWLLFLGSALFLQGSLWALARPAEQLAQGPVVAWWSALAGEDVYRYSAYRSYAPFFYGQPPVPDAAVLEQAVERASQREAAPMGKHGFYRRPETQREWLLWSEELDKPVWIVAKAGKQADYIAGIQGMERMDEQGGYVLLRRLPKP